MVYQRSDPAAAQREIARLIDLRVQRDGQKAQRDNIPRWEQADLMRKGDAGLEVDAGFSSLTSPNSAAVVWSEGGGGGARFAATLPMNTPVKNTQRQAAIESELVALQATSPRRNAPVKRTPSSNAALRTPSFTLHTPSEPRVLSPQFQPPRPRVSSTKRSRTVPTQEGWPVWMAKAPDIAEGESPVAASASAASSSATLPAESEATAAAAVAVVAPTPAPASMAAATTLQHAQSGCASAAALPTVPDEQPGGAAEQAEGALAHTPKRRVEKRTSSWLPQGLPPRILSLTGGLRPPGVSPQKAPHRPKQVAKDSEHSRPPLTGAAATPAVAASSAANEIDAGRGPVSAAISAADEQEAKPVGAVKELAWKLGLPVKIAGAGAAPAAASAAASSEGGGLDGFAPVAQPADARTAGGESTLERIGTFSKSLISGISAALFFSKDADAPRAAGPPAAAPLSTDAASATAPPAVDAASVADAASAAEVGSDPDTPSAGGPSPAVSDGAFATDAYSDPDTPSATEAALHRAVCRSATMMPSTAATATATANATANGGALARARGEEPLPA
eukprot:scaffold88938_cov55-Phaeocystis_antarctica.AAC.2